MNLKSIFTVSAMALAVTVSAALPLRTTATGHRINTAGHAVTAAKVDLSSAPEHAVMQAPENAITVPFTHSLGKNESAVTNLYTVIDANNDTKTWKPGGFTAYSVCMKPTDAAVTSADDWMISPAAYLEGGVTYRASLEVGRTLQAGSEEKFAIKVGLNPDVASMTSDAIAMTSVTERDFAEYTGDFSVAESGYYYFGIYCASEKDKSGNMKVCNFSVKVATPMVTPAAQGTMTYTLAPNGELKAMVSYTAPTLDTAGEPIAENMKVEIKTNWVTSHTFENVAPGETITFETSLYNNGNNRIEAIAWRGDVAGESLLLTGIFAGKDTPLPPSNLKAEMSADFRSVTISWDPVSAVGEHGGYVDTENITYFIFDAFGSYYDPAIAEVTATSYTVDYSDLQNQDFVAFQVTAGYDYYYSLDVTTDIFTVGTPDMMPWTESFADGYYNQMWCVDPASDSSVINSIFYDNELQTNADDETAEPEYLNSQDGDNGFFLLLPTEKDAMYGFFSPKISLTGATDPVIDFYYQGKGSELDVMVSTDGQKFPVARTINLRDEPTDDWTLCRVDMKPYLNNQYVQFELRIRATHNTEETTWSVPIDNIRVHNLVDYDVAVTKLSAPSQVKAGENIAVTVNVENRGTKPSGEVTVSVSRDGESVADFKAADMTPGEIKVFTFTDATDVFAPDAVTYVAKVTAASDMVAENDESAPVTVEIVKSALPVATNLAATSTPEGVKLTWDAPVIDHLTQTETVTEDFENPDYEPLTISNFGEWIMVDRDGAKTYSFLNDTRNPYRTYPMAFQLYSPDAAGVPDNYRIDCPVHSGNTMLAGWSCQGTNDNWLISPRLSAEAQTVKFFARSFSIAYGEEFEVYYSTGSTNPDDFVKVSTINGSFISGYVPEDWTLYSFDLPAGAERFAVRMTSYDSYALFLDDFEFTKGGQLPAGFEVNAFNIYRNKLLLTSDTVTGTEFTDATVEQGLHEYHVTAHYGIHGESAPSEGVTVSHTLSGIGFIANDGNVTISGGHGRITVTGAEGQKVTVVNTAGVIVSRGVAGPDYSVSVPAGIYIVKAGNYCAKAVVR